MEKILNGRVLPLVGSIVTRFQLNRGSETEKIFELPFYPCWKNNMGATCHGVITLSPKGQPDGVCNITVYKPWTLPLVFDVRLLSMILFVAQFCDAFVTDGTPCLPRPSEHLARHRSRVELALTPLVKELLFSS